MKKFYIETNEPKVFVLLKNKFGVSFSEFETPYQDMIYFEVCAQEKTADFLKIVHRFQQRGYTVRLYTKENGYYRPCILVGEGNEYFYTTFLYKMLINQNIDDEEFDKTRDFLENVTVTKKTSKRIEGTYQCSSWNEKRNKVLNQELGEFQIVEHQTQQDHELTTTVNRSQKKNLSIRPEEIKINEYYIPFTDEMIIHYADQLDIVELYWKREEMALSPFKVFNKKSQTLNNFENQILEAIKNYQNRKSKSRKKSKRG